MTEKEKLTLQNDKSTKSQRQADGGDQLGKINEQLEVAFRQGEALQNGEPGPNTLSVNQCRPNAMRRKTSCLVHGLFQDDRLKGEGPPEARKDHTSRKGDKDPHGHAEQDGVSLASRLLTKKQLSDMAFSIRELSKRLGNYRLQMRIKSVFLLTKAHDESLIALTREVAQWLMRPKESGADYTVYVEDTLKDNKTFNADQLVKDEPEADRKLKYWNNELCRREPHTFDIIVALGGDGTVLYASWLFQNVVPPVLSFALGSLGFLTKFDFDKFRDTLREVFHEGLTVSLRLRLEATVMRSQGTEETDEKGDLVHELVGDAADDHHTHKPELTRNILNDLVLDRGPNPTMSSIEVFGDHYHITTVQADGVCVATPTGSTAYNLAAGGSLCHPDNPVILVTAICAHTLSFRPIVIPDTVVLRLGVPYDGRASSWVSFDGKERVELRPGDYVTISASRYPFPTVLPLGRGGEDWIDSLSQTLNWNNRQKQKPFKEWR